MHSAKGCAGSGSEEGAGEQGKRDAQDHFALLIGVSKSLTSSGGCSLHYTRKLLIRRPCIGWPLWASFEAGVSGRRSIAVQAVSKARKDAEEVQ